MESNRATIMKRILFVLVILCVSLTHSYAQSIVGKRYRGFVDVSVLPGNDGLYKGFNSIGVGFNTTHGYQINPHLFVGGGVGVQYYSLDYFENTYAIPVYFDFRVDMLKSKVTPFFDVKVGYATADIKGVYFSPNFGVRFAVGRRVGLNLNVGYSMQGYTYTETHRYYKTLERAYIHSLNLSVGFDW